MPSRYHPIEDGLWDDAHLEGASFEEKGFFAFLCSNHRQRPSGIYRATDEQFAADTGLPIKRVKTYLADLHERTRIVRDGAWIFVRNYLKRQPKQERLLIGAEYDLKNCDSVIVLEAFGEHYPIFSKWSTDRLETVARRVNGFVPSEQYQSSIRAEQLQSSNTSRRQGLPDEAVWGSPEALALKYNRETTENCPTVTRLPSGSALRAKCAAYLKLYPDEEWWTVVFEQYHRSRFLSGKVQPSNGHERFKPDLAWLLSKGKDGAENVQKVHDGRYRDGA